LVNPERGYVLGLHMRDDIRSQLTDFAAEFMADAQVEQRLRGI
jgi:hypothetical protein